MAQDNEYRECPFCAEKVKAKAIKCKHCRSVLDVEPAVKSPAVVETPSKEKIPCPECGKDIYAGATKCRYCKASIVTGDQQIEETPQMIDKTFIDLREQKLSTAATGFFSKLDKTVIENSKEKIASAFTGLFSRIDKTFLEKNKRIITLSAVGLFALILIAFTSVQLINRFSDRAADSGLGTDSSLAADLNGELNEEEIIESPLVIIFANRTVEFEDKKPSNPEEVILVLMFSGVTDATVENSYLMHNGQRYPFFSGYRGSMGEVLTFMYAAFVPKAVLEFELYVGDYPPETVFADEEIQEEL